MNPKVKWPDNTLPAEIYWAPGVLTGLEMMAADGLLAMPRTGLGIGGLLLGTRSHRRIEIAKALEITCSHAMGPAFVLTPEEIAVSTSPRDDDDSHEREVVGWFCSKPSFSKDPGPMALSVHDRLLFDELCPKLWQMALLIRPSMGKTTTAAFAIRRAGDVGEPFFLGGALELAWQELAAFQEPAGVDRPATLAEPAALERPVGKPISEPPLIAEPVRAVETPTAPPPVAIPVRMPRNGTLFGTPEARPETAHARWPFRVLLAAVLLAMIASAGFLIRSYWMPRPPIALMASSDWTGRVAILWNAEALSQQNHATLVIEDGTGPLRTIHLTDAELRAGNYSYDCLSGKLTATLLAGELSDSVTLKTKTETYRPESGISK